MGKAGSHGSGVIEYPAYMQDMHEDWLTTVDSLMTAAQAAPSPYFGESAYDPTTYLNSIETEFGLVKADVDSIDHLVDWEQVYNKAKNTTDVLYDEDTLKNLFNAVGTNIKSRVDGLLSDGTTSVLTAVVAAIQEALSQVVTNSYITSVVNSYAADARDDLLKAEGRYAGAIYDAGAVNTTGYAVGMAILELGHKRDVERFRANLHINNMNTVMQYFVSLYNNILDKYIQANIVMRGEDIANLMVNKKDRQMVILNSIDEMLKTMTFKSSILAEKLRSRIQACQIGILAKTEQVNRDLEIDILDSKWDFDLFTYSCNVLGSIAGTASMIDRPVSTAQSMLSGALTGAGAMASTGNPWLIAAGAVGGATMGYFI